jgi:Holliday junction DNA helicase RuvB
MAIKSSKKDIPKKESSISNSEKLFETGLRPFSFSDFVGQEVLKTNLKIFISGAKNRSEPLGHMLLSGPPGLGKTTLSSIIAIEMGGNLRITSGPALEKNGDLAALLTSLENNDILFIDEIHRLKKPLEEMLYSAMEDFALDLIIGKGAGAKSMRLTIPPFTLIGATTKLGSISGPLRDRFGNIAKFQFYSIDEMIKIVKRSAKILKIDIDDYSSKKVALASRCTPRISNRIVKQLRDFSHSENQKIIDKKISDKGFLSLGIDEYGLDLHDREFLKLIFQKFNSGPVGLSTLSSAFSEEKETIEEIIEPYLLKEGFLQRTSQGRVLTELGKSIV